MNAGYFSSKSAGVSDVGARRQRRFRWLAAAVAVSGVAVQAQRSSAAVITANFTNATGGSYVTGTNWDAGDYPSGVDAIANIPSNQTANRSITGATAALVTLGTLNIDNSTTFTNTISGSMTLQASGTNSAVINVTGSGAVANTVSTAFTLNSPLVVNVANTAGNTTSGALSLTGGISGTNGLTKLAGSSGLLTISTAAKTYSGPTLLDTNSGRTRISASGLPTATSSFTVNSGAQLTIIAPAAQTNYAFGVGNLNLNGTGLAVNAGAIRNDSGALVTITNPVVLQSDTLISVQATGGSQATAGASGVGTGNTTLTGIVSGSGRLTFTAPGSNVDQGSLILTNANTYAGGTLVAGGLLSVTGSGTLGSGNVTVDDATAPSAIARLSIGTGTSNVIADTATLTMNASNPGLGAGTAPSGYAILASGVNETVGHLVLGGLNEPAGTYGSSTSGAQFTNDTYFQGGGVITVAATPEPASLTAIGLGAVGLLARRRRAK